MEVAENVLFEVHVSFRKYNVINMNSKNVKSAGKVFEENKKIPIFDMRVGFFACTKPHATLNEIFVSTNYKKMGYWVRKK